MAKHGGARKGSGRKSKTEEAQKIELINNSIPTAEIIDLCANQARKGNMKAIELLMYYTIGKPKEQKDVSFKFIDIKPIQWVDTNE